MPKLFDEVTTKIPTKTVSQRGIGSWEESRTPSEIFDLVVSDVDTGEEMRDAMMAGFRTDYEEMGAELGERTFSAKGYLNGMFETTELEADGRTAEQWAIDNGDAFNEILKALASLEASQDAYFDGAAEQWDHKKKAATAAARYSMYIARGGLAWDFIRNIPAAAKIVAKAAIEFGDEVIEESLKRAFPWGWAAAGFLVYVAVKAKG